MTLQEQYIEKLRDIITNMVRNVAENPRNPWIKPSIRPLMDGYNRPFENLDLLSVTYFRQKNNIRTSVFCHAYQRKLFQQPIKKDEPGTFVLKKDGTPITVYPCQIKSNRIDEKISRIEQNRKKQMSKNLMRMHLEKVSPINDEGALRYIYRNIAKSMPLNNESEKLIAEISATIIALELGLSKKIEPENICLLDNWLNFVNDEDIDINEFIKNISNRAKQEMIKIANTKIKDQMFKNHLTETIENLKVKDNIPRFKNLSEILTPTIKIK